MNDISLISSRLFECSFTEPMINEDFLKEVKLGQLKTIKHITRFKIIFSLIVTGRIKPCQN